MIYLFIVTESDITSSVHLKILGVPHVMSDFVKINKSVISVEINQQNVFSSCARVLCTKKTLSFQYFHNFRSFPIEVSYFLMSINRKSIHFVVT